MSVWKSIAVRPAIIRGVYGSYVVVETQRDGEVCLQDPHFISTEYKLNVGDIVELHTMQSQLVSHRRTYAFGEELTKTEQRHIGQTWTFHALYEQSN